jgi:hypothetical protein
MKLLAFRVRDFRSVKDSGDIVVSQRTALVGRNESGKTNLLRALESLNPPGGLKAFNDVKDFPRERDLGEYKPDLRMLETTWELSDEDRKALADIHSLAGEVSHVYISRDYAGMRYVSWKGLKAYEIDKVKLNRDLDRISSGLGASLVGNAEADETNKAQKLWRETRTTLQSAAEVASTWAKLAVEHLPKIQTALRAANLTIGADADSALSELIKLADDISKISDRAAKARAWATSRLPVFIFLDEYPELRGHQDIQAYISRKQANPGALDGADKNFEKLVKVANLSPEELQKSLGEQHDRRQQLTNRAGATVTAKLREIWRDRELKVRFNLDAQHFDTLISDPNTVYDTEINLDERSRGLKWFFSFYISFAADTAGGPAANAILLLDEPGLFLHAVAQADLLSHFATDFKNQILYTTHSPFMVPIKELASVRTVNIAQNTGTTVTNDPTGDSRTLFPLQQALGYNLTQTLFIGAKNLVVEGVTDFWYLQTVSDYLNESAQSGLNADIVITPAGGSQRVSYMVALLSSQDLDVSVLLDSEQGTPAARDELVKSKLLRDNRVLFIADQFAAPQPGEADVEDMLDPAGFAELVNASYASELFGKTLNLNPQIPRIVKRYEDAFAAVGLTFHKTRPARLFLREFGKEPEKFISGASSQRFENLCRAVNEQMAKVGTTRP